MLVIRAIKAEKIEAKAISFAFSINIVDEDFNFE